MSTRPLSQDLVRGLVDEFGDVASRSSPELDSVDAVTRGPAAHRGSEGPKK